MKSIDDKETFGFTILHYLTLFLHVLRGLFLAKYLGASVFGLYGLVILAQQQLSASALGMREAITLKLSGVDEKNITFQKYIKSALSFTLFVGVLLFFIGILSFFYKEHFETFHPIGGFIYLIFFHGVFSVSNEVIINILRLKGRILIIGIVELLYGISIILWALFIIFFDKKLELFFQLSLITNFLVFLFYMGNVINYFKIFLEFKRVLSLLKVGIPLLVLNVSTILMITMGQWMIGIHDSLYSLGIFSFAVSLATIVNYGLGSLTWVYFASLIADYKTSSEDNISKISDELRGYLFSAFLILLSIIVFLYFSLIKFFFEEYFISYFIFLMIFFSQFSQLFSYPDSTLLLTKNKINHISVICIFVSTFIGIISYLIYEFSHVYHFEYFSRIDIVSFGIFLGNIIYMSGIFFLANAFKTYDFKKDLAFIIYFLMVSLMFVLFYILDINFLAIFFSAIFLFLFHSKSILNFYKRLEKVFK